jgi:beta-aspartyl-peptidase (threonine type)
MRNMVARLLFAWIIAVTAASTLAAETPKKLEYAIAIHGGAGVEPDKLTAADRKAHEAALKEALDTGTAILAKGGTAMDAVEQTIRVLEDNPLYNAGKGAVFNSEGKHELDASIMDGKTGKAGAVAGVTKVKNPISLARLVMTQTRHVLLQGAGAEKFADEQIAKGQKQIEIVPNEWFSTESRRKDWEDAKRRAAEKEKQLNKNKMGTVGCVALDKQGNLAAGTSTGGLTNKKWGRVGDSPVIGAGTYASNATCAVSCTGTGEFFIRHSVGFHVHALMAYKGLELDAAVKQLIDHVLVEEPEIGGLIALDKDGRVSMRTNTPGMACAMADSTGKVEIKLEK